MTGELQVQLLPARQGDAIWIRWGDANQILVDMGTRATGKAIRKRLSKLDEKGRHFDLLVVTHIDVDHIGGVMSGLVEAKATLPPVTFDDIWFNGWDHLHGRKTSQLEGMGTKDGEALSLWLATRPWNKQFKRGPVRREAKSFPEVTLADGLTLTVLGPSKERLKQLQSTWTQAVHDALAKQLRKPKGKLEELGTTDPPVLDTQQQLEHLAQSQLGTDGSEANGTSISLLLEYDGKRVLLTGDGFADDVTNALKELASQRSELIDKKTKRIRLDLVKMPHHGSQNNISRDLVEAVTCPTWAFSSDGTIYKHPDPPAIARILKWGVPRPTLIFNEPSTFNSWWQRPQWKSELRYDVAYGTKEEGITWPLPKE